MYHLCEIQTCKIRATLMCCIHDADSAIWKWGLRRQTFGKLMEWNGNNAKEISILRNASGNWKNDNGVLCPSKSLQVHIESNENALKTISPLSHNTLTLFLFLLSYMLVLQNRLLRLGLQRLKKQITKKKNLKHKRKTLSVQKH